MLKVTNIKDALIQESSEISINKGDYIGYVVSINDIEIVIQNYDMENEAVKIININTLRNIDEDIYFSNCGLTCNE